MALDRTTFRRSALRQRGVTLVELMIAIALSLFMIAALVTLYVNNSAARTELDRASRQIENGRFAIDVLRDNIAMAGYFGEVSRRDVTTFTTPSPCTNVLANMGWSTVAVPTPISMPAAVQGPAVAGEMPSGWACPSGLNRLDGTGVLVVRYVEPEPLAAATAAANTHYVQTSGCIDSTRPFLLGIGPGAGSFTLTTANCTTVAPIREYVSKLFYVRCNSGCLTSDADPPVLMVREWRGGVFTDSVLADGIEDLQFEFGRDTNGDGVVDDFVAATATAADWGNVVAVRIRLIARSSTPSPGYTDDKTYDRGPLFGAYAVPDVRFKRRSYTALVQMPNVAGPRENP